jgi:hypothetical protein
MWQASLTCSSNSWTGSAGLVEFCTVLSATYHRRTLPDDTVTFCAIDSTATQQTAAGLGQQGRNTQQEAAVSRGALHSAGRATSSSEEGGSTGEQPAAATAAVPQAWPSVAHAVTMGTALQQQTLIA